MRLQLQPPLPQGLCWAIQPSHQGSWGWRRLGDSENQGAQAQGPSGQGLRAVLLWGLAAGGLEPRHSSPGLGDPGHEGTGQGHRAQRPWDRAARAARAGVLPSFSGVSSESLNLSELPRIVICKPGQYRTRFTVGGPWYPAPQRQERSVGTAGSAPDHLSPAVRRLRPHLRRAQILWLRGWKPLPQPWGALGGGAEARDGSGGALGWERGARTRQSPPLPVAGRVYF